MLYTLAGVEGEHGWGRAGDTTAVMAELAKLGVDTSFTLGDRDYAMCLVRTMALADGATLSMITQGLTGALGVHDVAVLPATDDELRTWIQTVDGQWLEFQEYFVDRRHRDPVAAIDYRGAEAASPAPGVIDAITGADTLVIAPSNPPLSIWPILAVGDIRSAVESHPATVAISPLFGGRALKGPAAEVMEGLGLPAGTAGILEAYHGLVDTLVVDAADEADTALGDDVRIHAMNTRLDGDDQGSAVAAAVIEAMAP